MTHVRAAFPPGWEKQTGFTPTNAFVAAVQRWSALPVLAAARTDTMNNLRFREHQLLDQHGPFRRRLLRPGAGWLGANWPGAGWPGAVADRSGAEGPGPGTAGPEAVRPGAAEDDERVGCAAIGLVWGLALSFLLWAFLLWGVLALVRLWNG